MRDIHNALSSGAMNTLMKSVSFVGSPTVVLAVSVVLALLLLYRNMRRAALFLSVAVGGAYLLDDVGKLSFHRARPDFYPSLAHASGYSFPSGHATGSMALACALVALLSNSRLRGLFVSIAVALVVLVGLSRLYLGVHYPSDIIAGWFLATAVVALANLVIAPPPLAGVTTKVEAVGVDFGHPEVEANGFVGE